MDLLALIFMCVAALIFVVQGLGRARDARINLGTGLFFMAVAFIFQFTEITQHFVVNKP